MNDRLYRSVDDRVLAGVCGGLAVRLGVDPSLVRIAYAVIALLSGIFPLLVLYVIMAVVVPEEPTGFAGLGRSPTPPGPDSIPGWVPPGWTGGAGGADPGPPGGEEGPTTSPPAAGAGPTWDEAAARGSSGRGVRRADDTFLAAIGGLVLVGLGVYFLVRDRLAIDWGVVWAAGLVALGIVVVIAAVRPRR
jgi:phage shock protein C